MAAYLLDTDIIIPLLKRQGEVSIRVKEKLQEVLKNNAVIIISPVMYYEHVRGLYHANADADEQLDMTPTGEGIDKDVLIAAQARQHRAIVVTSNDRHYQYLGATIEK